MVIYLGADHRGAELKNRMVGFVKGLGYEIMDVHPDPMPDDDYPEIAAAAAGKAAASTDGSRAILFCGSGAGMDIAANKVHGIRSVLGLSPDQVYDARNDDDVNVLTISSDFTLPEVAEQMAKVFLNTPFAGAERFVRRVGKLKQMETA